MKGGIGANEFSCVPFVLLCDQVPSLRFTFTLPFQWLPHGVISSVHSTVGNSIHFGALTLSSLSQCFPTCDHCVYLLLDVVSIFRCSNSACPYTHKLKNKQQTSPVSAPLSGKKFRLAFKLAVCGQSLHPLERGKLQKSWNKVHLSTGYTLSTQNKWTRLIPLIYAQIHVTIFPPITKLHALLCTLL